MPQHDDARAVLDVPPDADEATIRRAFRARVKATHPDLGGDPDELRAVLDAYRTLSAALVERNRRSPARPTGPVAASASPHEPPAGAGRRPGALRQPAVRAVDLYRRALQDLDSRSPAAPGGLDRLAGRRPATVRRLARRPATSFQQVLAEALAEVS